MGGVRDKAADGAYDFASPFLLAPGGTRLVQIQPTRRCNLRCQHCYSQSGPEQREDLQYQPLETFLVQARDLGYNYVGVSGGNRYSGKNSIGSSMPRGRWVLQLPSQLTAPY